MQTKRIWLCWLLGATMTAALLVALYLISDFRFENSDDSLLLKAFMGFEGGAPANFTLVTHPLLAWALCALGTAMPGGASSWSSISTPGRRSHRKYSFERAIASPAAMSPCGSDWVRTCERSRARPRAWGSP